MVAHSILVTDLQHMPKATKIQKEEGSLVTMIIYFDNFNTIFLEKNLNKIKTLKSNL